MGSTNQGLLLVSAMWITLLLWGEIRHTSWLQGRAAAVLASFSLVAANVIAKTLLNTPDFGIGVLDLIYAKCIVLSFLGVAFTKFHPDKPMVVPYDAQQGVRALSVGFFSSASSMLILGGLSLGPATAVLLTVSLQSSLTTFWKQFLCDSCDLNGLTFSSAIRMWRHISLWIKTFFCSRIGHIEEAFESTSSIYWCPWFWRKNTRSPLHITDIGWTKLRFHMNFSWARWDHWTRRISGCTSAALCHPPGCNSWICQRWRRWNCRPAPMSHDGPWWAMVAMGRDATWWYMMQHDVTNHRQSPAITGNHLWTFWFCRFCLLSVGYLE